MSKKNDPAVERREAALDAIRRGDQVRELSNAGRATAADVHRLAAANERLAAATGADDGDEQQR